MYRAAPTYSCALTLAFSSRSVPNYGGFGKGEMHWYALWVMTKSEAELGQDLEASISRLGQVENSEGKLVARDVESWVPKKMKLKWNNRHALLLFIHTAFAVMLS
jgi:hypothetical protein